MIDRIAQHFAKKHVWRFQDEGKTVEVAFGFKKAVTRINNGHFRFQYNQLPKLDGTGYEKLPWLE